MILTNQLGTSPSPYLKQHADNPIHWQLWDAKKIPALAGQLNRPIFLSIGYSACHWCHVMAHQTFENQQVADFLNQHFIAVKIDREEYPTIDVIYQQAIALLGIQGGWPLTIFTTPDGKPFWGGTYFPLNDQYGRPGFMRILQTLHHHWHHKNADVIDSAQELTQAMQKTSQITSRTASQINLQHINQIGVQLSNYLDHDAGGIGGAPKFPQTQQFEFMARYARMQDASDYQLVVENWLQLTLDNICLGGLYDHVGGGFYRYATDKIWLVPHFEKMLYDNALLVNLLLFTHATNPLYKNAINESLNWCMREMLHQGGGFYAALDADSDGKEGAFYLWDKDEIVAVLQQDAPAFIDAYQVTEAGNFEDKNILHQLETRNVHATNQLPADFNHAKSLLLQHREMRTRPACDNKILTDWNGLMINSFAYASMIYKNEDYQMLAEQTFDFIVNNLTRKENGLYHCYADETAYIEGRLDDYANMIDAAITLYSLTGKVNYLQHAQKWTDYVLQYFTDASGAYHMNEIGSDILINPISAIDNPVPSGNGVLAKTLFRLGVMSGQYDLIEKSDNLINAFYDESVKNFASICGLLNSYLSNQNLICFAIKTNDTLKQTVRQMILEKYQHDCVITDAEMIHEETTLYQVDNFADNSDAQDELSIIICRNRQCMLPITSLTALQEFLETDDVIDS